MRWKLGLLGVTLALVILMIFYGNKDNLTANAVIGEASALNVITQNYLGEPLEDVSVFVNEEYEGLTGKYGTTAGSKKIILREKENIVTVEKKGYEKPLPQKINLLSQEQLLIFILKEKKATYQFAVENNQGVKIQDAKVDLFYQNDTENALDNKVTDSDGLVEFNNLKDGDYLVRIRKTEFLKAEKRFTINVEDKSRDLKRIILQTFPQLEIQITNVNGLTLNEAEVMLYDQQSYNTPGLPPLNIAYSGDNGELVFKNINYDKEYVLTVKKSGYDTQTAFFTPSDENHRLFVHLYPSK